ncbi:MAG: class I SAM-dependent methyltransferase [Candidatus Bathyarchaeota archaeon]|nr:MAG: class I SAM-dependent methyltransferase [Candidatus Bathyarchaeota archaeon]
MAEWKEKRLHMQYYNNTSHLYNNRYGVEQNRKIKAVVENLEFGKQRFILDLGCGTGLLISEILNISSDFVGLDISKGMLRKVDRLIKRSMNICLVLADADNTPFRHGCFDTAIVITLLQNMPDPRNTLQEIKRITKPKALIIATGLKKCFTKQSFTKLLKNAKLKTRLLETDSSIKCHVAICKKYN